MPTLQSRFCSRPELIRPVSTQCPPSPPSFQQSSSDGGAMGMLALPFAGG